MLDSDVAKLYHYKTKNVNKAMKRNIDRFPDDFCFQLTEGIDNRELYHSGASLKDLGKKCFAISKIEDVEYIEKMSEI